MPFPVFQCVVGMEATTNATLIRCIAMSLMSRHTQQCKLSILAYCYGQPLPPVTVIYILFSLSLSMLEFVDRVRLYGGRDRAIGSTGQSLLDSLLCVGLIGWGFRLTRVVFDPTFLLPYCSDLLQSV